MDPKKIMQIFQDTAYIRMGGSSEELRAAKYIQDQLSGLGLNAEIQSFEVPMSNLQKAELLVDGISIPCKGYLNAGSHEVEAPLYYLAGKDKYALEGCRGKIVLFDGYLGYWMYRDLLENGAVGFVLDGKTAAPSIFIITNTALSGFSKAYMTEKAFDEDKIALYEKMGGVPEYEGRVLVFGMVVSGMETAEKIAAGANSGYTGGYSAAEPQKIISAEIK